MHRSTRRYIKTSSLPNGVPAGVSRSASNASRALKEPPLSVAAFIQAVTLFTSSKVALRLDIIAPVRGSRISPPENRTPELIKKELTTENKPAKYPT